MSELGETYKEWGKIKKAQKSEALVENTKALKKSGLFVEFKNRGFHAVVERKIDFYPTTNNWKCRDCKKKHYSYFNMINHLKEGCNHE